MEYRLMWVLMGCVLLTAALLACGPANQGRSDAIPIPASAASVSPQGLDETTELAERMESRGEAPDRHGWNDAGQPEQETENEVKPTEEPSPTRPPRPTSTPPSPKSPAPGHPDGVAGCKLDRMFDGSQSSSAYQIWCQDQLMAQVEEECSSRPSGEQRQCGDTIAQEYRGYLFRYGPARCVGITEEATRQECISQSWVDFDLSQKNLFEGWNKLRTAANRDAEVVKAWNATITCLEGEGFKEVNEDILFPWQDFIVPKDYQSKEVALTGADKELRERIVGPSQECAIQEGLFWAQDVAWTAELKRLETEEPALVADLIREGLLEELEKPGASVYLSGKSAN